MITLAPRAFIVLWEELERWILPTQAPSSSNLPKDWSLASIRELVTQVTQRVKVEKEQSYKLCGVKWYGEGVFLRETVSGETTSASFLTPVVPRAFIYNRLFAWKESFAVVPPELDGCFVSGEFPQFVVDDKRLMPEYLYLYFRLDSTIRAVNAASVGTAAVSRNRFKEEEFFSFRIPLPPLSVQRAIVARWQKVQLQIAAARQHLEQRESEIPKQLLLELGIPFHDQGVLPKVFAVFWKDLERWSVSYAARMLTGAADVERTKYPLKTLGELSRISYGVQKCPTNRPGKFARPYLRVANVQKGRLDLSEIKYIDVPDLEMNSFRLEPGDLLVCEGNSAELVGRPAIWEGQIPDCVHQNHILKVRVQPSSALPEFVLEYMHSPPARNHFRARAKFTTNLASINSNDLRELLVPLPPLAVQRALVERIAEARAAIAREQETAARLARETEAEIEAMILGVKPVPAK